MSKKPVNPIEPRARLLAAFERVPAKIASEWPVPKSRLRGILTETLGWPLDGEQIRLIPNLTRALDRAGLSICAEIENRLDKQEREAKPGTPDAKQLHIARGVFLKRTGRINEVRFVHEFGGGRAQYAKMYFPMGVNSLRPVINTVLSPLGPDDAKRVWEAAADVAAEARELV